MTIESGYRVGNVLRIWSTILTPGGGIEIAATTSKFVDVSHRHVELPSSQFDLVNNRITGIDHGSSRSREAACLSLHPDLMPRISGQGRFDL